MTLCGKPLRAFPQSLEIASRFPHSHRLDGCYTLSEFKLRKESSPPPSPTLQAHPSIGKDWVMRECDAGVPFFTTESPSHGENLESVRTRRKGLAKQFFSVSP